MAADGNERRTPVTGTEPGAPSADRLGQLRACGQSVWLDFVRRSFIERGELAALISAGVTGVTSNPAIFEQAIAGSEDYDAAIAELLRDRDLAPGEIYEALAIADIRAAADELLPVYQATAGADGYVSIEVSPHLAHHAEATVAEAVRLHRAIGRPNLMVKVPATEAGLDAIERLVGQGISINVTLIFDRAMAARVCSAFAMGLELFARAGGDLAKIAGVASVFISRLDTVVDAEIIRRISAGSAQADDTLGRLRGRIAIANGRLAYRDWQVALDGARWRALLERGAQRPRLLWASTGTKDPAYPDVLYVESLIAPETVNTMPPATLAAFRDHGVARADVFDAAAEAEAEIALAHLARFGISLERMAARLASDGLRQFIDAFDRLIAAVARKRALRQGALIDRAAITLPPSLDRAVGAILEEWRVGGIHRRLWARDPMLWTGSDEAQWLGWLDIVERERRDVDRYVSFQAWVREQGFVDVLLLGMGGSSLGPEVIAGSFGPQPGFPTLTLLDSTNPQQVQATLDALDLSKTLVIVSSKSGSTLETNLFLEVLRPVLRSAVGEGAMSRIVVITDPGSSLDGLARREAYRIFHGDPRIGGRYSVLSPFGLVPAAAIGLDLPAFLDATSRFIRSCGPDVPPAENPALVLGALIGAAAPVGRDKLTVLATPDLTGFGAWVEQLVAELTGKRGHGVVPIDREPIGDTGDYGEDRVFLSLRFAGQAPPETDALLDALRSLGHPVIRIELTDPEALGQEFFRLELATAASGIVLGINPFDQPDVEATKRRTRDLTKVVERTGALPRETPLFRVNSLSLFADRANATALAECSAGHSLEHYLAAHFGRAETGDYLAILSFLPMTDEITAAITRLRRSLRQRTGAATTSGFGPRYLHSTGQIHKGGPNSGVFVLLTADTGDHPIPGQSYGFAAVEAAQARGDFEILAERGRRVIRLDLGSDISGGLALIEQAAAVCGKAQP